MKQTPLFRLLLACVVAGTAGTTGAEVVPWLYAADVAVPSQSDADRRRAAGTALAEVLGRLTGLREIPFGDPVDAALRDSERYYVRYGFVRRDVGSGAGGAAVHQTHLQIEFERNALLELLRRAGLPVWSADRPVVLAWVVLQGDDARQIVSAAPVDAAAAEVVSAMRREARRRGLVLTFPLLDLDDRGLRAADLWGRFWPAILRSSSRYAADLVWLGRIAPGRVGRWTSSWELQSPTRDQEPATPFVHAGSTAGAAAGAAVHRLADALAQRFAVRGGNLDTVALTVRGAPTVRAYAAVLSYLQSREYISRVDVRAAEPDALHFQLHSTSDRGQLLELLSMGGYLSASRTAAPLHSSQPDGAPASRSELDSSDNTPRRSGTQWEGLELTWVGTR